MLTGGVTLGHYSIVSLLGVGGMGEVYCARDTQLGRNVALKVISADPARDPSRINRFSQEARAAGALSHPNVCAIYDFGQHEGAPFVVMELLEGQSLRGRLRRGPIPVRKSVAWCAQAALGLAAAHDKGIVHCDLKPENLFLTKDGRVKVLDFGLAKLTRPSPQSAPGADAMTTATTLTGVIRGTTAYMSPEQVRGEPVDHRTDIFALGSILYELLSGRRAFPGKSFYETTRRIVSDDPPPLGESGRAIQPSLESIMRRCLEKDPEERFQSAKDLAFDLERYLEAGARPAPAHSRGATRRRAACRLLAAALAGAVIVAAGALLLRQSQPAPRPVFHKLSFGRGRVDSARFMPDGNGVIYSARWEDRESELFSMRVDAAGATEMGLHDATVVAVRGGEVAVLMARLPATGPGRTLAVLPVGGGTPRPVFEGALGADWSPDAKGFAVVSSVEGQNRIEYPPGNVLYRTFGNISEIRISPDGERVAFLLHRSTGGACGAVMIVDRRGHATVLADSSAAGQGAVSTVAWSPDGAEVWFTGAEYWGWGTLRAVSLDLEVRTVLDGPLPLWLADVSRDGRVLLSSGTQTSEVWGRAPGDSTERSWSWLDGSIVDGLSSDGESLLFTECSVGGGRGLSSWLRRFDGSSPMLLAAGVGSDISPDGSQVVLLGGTASDITRRPLILMPTGPGEGRTLPKGPVDVVLRAVFFPSGGKLLVYGYEVNRPRRLYIQDLAGGPPQPLSPEGLAIVSFGWGISPDGRFIGTMTKDGPVLIPVGGGDPRPVVGLLPGEWPLAWAGDGESVFVVEPTRGPVRRIVRFELATRRRTPWRQLRPRDPSGAYFNSGPVIARDGEVYFYSLHRWLNNLFMVEGLR